MVRNILVLLFSLASVGVFSQGIDFKYKDLDKAIAKAQSEGKMIFIDVYTSWCGPCKWMDNNVFNQGATGNYFNQTFINVKLDAESAKGSKTANAYNVTSYPTFLFLDPVGKRIHEAHGVYNVDNMMIIAHQAQSETSNLDYYERNLNKHKMDADYMRKYTLLLQDLRMTQSKEIAKTYLNLVDDWSTQEASVFIFENIGIQKDRLFEYMVDHLDQFNRDIGEDKVNRRIYDVALANLGPSATSEELEFELGRYIPGGGKMMVEKIFIDQTLEQRHIPSIGFFAQRANDYVNNYGSTNWVFLNNIAWAIYEQTDAQADFEIAKQIGIKSIEVDDNYYNNDTVAAICMMLGQKNAATAYANKALQLAQKEGLDGGSTKELLKLINEIK